MFPVWLQNVEKNIPEKQLIGPVCQPKWFGGFKPNVLTIPKPVRDKYNGRISNRVMSRSSVYMNHCLKRTDVYSFLAHCILGFTFTLTIWQRLVILLANTKTLQEKFAWWKKEETMSMTWMKPPGLCQQFDNSQDYGCSTTYCKSE